MAAFFTFALDFAVFVLLLLIVRACRDCCSLFKVSVCLRNLFPLLTTKRETHDYQLLCSQFVVVSAYYLCSFHFKAFPRKAAQQTKKAVCWLCNDGKIREYLCLSHPILSVTFFSAARCSPSHSLLHEWITRKAFESRRRQMRYLLLKWDNKNSFGVCLLFFFQWTQLTVRCFN